MILRSTITCPDCGTAKAESMPACSSTHARAAACGSGRSRATAACFAPMARCRVRQSRAHDPAAVHAASEGLDEETLKAHARLDQTWRESHERRRQFQEPEPGGSALFRPHVRLRREQV